MTTHARHQQQRNIFDQGQDLPLFSGNPDAAPARIVARPVPSPWIQDALPAVYMPTSESEDARLIDAHTTPYDLMAWYPNMTYKQAADILAGPGF